MFDDPTYPVKMGKFFSIISKPLKTTWPIVACAGSYKGDSKTAHPCRTAS